MATDEYNKTDLKSDFIKNGISSMPGGFFVYRADYDKEEIIYANKALLQIFECETAEEFEELTGGSFKGIVYEEDYYIIEQSIMNQIDSNENKFDEVNYRIKTRTGQIKYIEDFGSYVEDPVEGPLFYVFVSDPQDSIDPVTGLSNRKIFFQSVERRISFLRENDRKPVIIALDLSGMRGFNSKYGFKEGDRLLRAFGEILKDSFGSDYCSRFGEDHFCAYSDSGGVEVILNEVVERFQNNREGRTLPVKIGITNYEEGLNLYDIYERARLACQTQKEFYGSSIGYYDDTIAKDFSKNEYILSHVDEAIQNEWIKVYLQPVIRSLTGQVCSGEALTRWIDPELGFISPGEFIPLLEKTGLSYKVDTYMIKKVTELLHKEIQAGGNPVPVSVNISRTDFLYCDPVQVVVEALETYNLSRSLICVEITESAFTDQPEAIKEAIDRFHYEGIEVWMDDFGSGYSSLNVLKDFNFDEIKIDMVFLRNFNDKSRIIVTKAVQMAKQLGIHTLAEGVETIEHVEFLKSIGCEKIQGYFYAKPIAYEEQLENMRSNGYVFENKEIASVYEKTGLVNLATNRSRALFLYANGQFSRVFMNDLYIQTLATVGIVGEEAIEQSMNNPKTLVNKKLRELAEKTIKSKTSEVMTYVIKDTYFHASFKDVADSRYGSMILASIDRTAFEEQEMSNEMDEIFRNIGSMYDSIYMLDIKEDTRTVIATNQSNEHVGDVAYGIKEFYSAYTVRNIYPEDLERWKSIFESDDLSTVFDTDGRGFYLDAHRMKKEDGNYSWYDLIVIRVPGSESCRFLVCIRPSVLEFREDLAENIGGESKEKTLFNLSLFRSIIRGSDIKFFWKDTERRFLGASDEFNRYFGFESTDPYIGKTDEEMEWHLSENHFREDEERVLKRGEIIRNSLGKMVIDGVPHSISATKYPIYTKGRIVGLMGYFVDIDLDIESESRLFRGSLIDPLTGLMNTFGQMGTLIEMYDNYLNHGQDFAFISIEMTSYKELISAYGSEVGEDLVRLISTKILNAFGPNVIISRIYGGNFGIAVKNATWEKADMDAEKCVSIIRDIKEIDNRQCNLQVIYGIALGSECNSVQEVTETARKRAKGIALN